MRPEPDYWRDERYRRMLHAVRMEDDIRRKTRQAEYTFVAALLVLFLIVVLL